MPCDSGLNSIASSPLSPLDIFQGSLEIDQSFFPSSSSSSSEDESKSGPDPRSNSPSKLVITGLTANEMADTLVKHASKERVKYEILKGPSKGTLNRFYSYRR